MLLPWSSVVSQLSRRFPSSLRVKFLSLYSPRRFLTSCPQASLLHPLPLPSPHPLSSSHPGPGCCASTPGSFLQLLLNVSSSQRVSLTLCSLPNPHNSPSSQHAWWPGIGFSPIFVVCIPLRRHIILLYFVYSCFPIPRNMLFRDKKHKYLMNIYQGNKSPISSSCQVHSHWRGWWNKIPVSLFDDEAFLYTYESTSNFLYLNRKIK